MPPQNTHKQLSQAWFVLYKILLLDAIRFKLRQYTVCVIFLIVSKHRIGIRMLNMLKKIQTESRIGPKILSPDNPELSNLQFQFSVGPGSTAIFGHKSVTQPFSILKTPSKILNLF